MTLKNNDNTQFARVANVDGSSPLPAAAPGDALAPLCDDQGHLVVAPYVGGSVLSGAPTLVDSAAVSLWYAVSAAAAKLYQAWGAQDSGGLLWVQAFNLAAGPPGVAVPVISPIPVDSPGFWSFSFPEGISFSTGIVIAYSTTQSTYTAPVTGGWISALIR